MGQLSYTTGPLREEEPSDVPLRRQCWAAACLLFWAGSVSAHAGEVPRYAPKPGQVLNYEENQTWKGSDENSTYQTTWRIWVLGQSDDGSWRMVVREAIKMLDDNKARGKRMLCRPQVRASICTRTAWFSRTPLLGTRFDASHLLPRLPRSEKHAAGGWQAHDERDDATTRYELVDSAGVGRRADRRFRHESEHLPPRKDLRGAKILASIPLRSPKGLVVRGEIEGAFGSHLNSTNKGTIELKAIEILESGKLATFRDDMNRALDASDAYRTIYRSAHQPPATKPSRS